MSANNKLEVKTVSIKPNNYILDVIVRPNTTDIKVIDEVLLKRSYQKPKIGFLLSNNDCWLDLGGNIGTFALFALSQGCKQVISFEPEPDNLKLLEANLQSNFPQKTGKLSKYGSWIIEPYGVTHSNQTVTKLYLCKTDYNKYRHTVYPKRGRRTIDIPMKNFKLVLKQYPQCNAIKMDIEGSEIEILESMRPSDWTNINKLVFEYSFDIDDSIPRFLSIIKNLKRTFSVVEYSKVKETELRYTHFPQCTMVYCLR